jgi:hypothetical protein
MEINCSVVVNDQKVVGCYYCIGLGYGCICPILSLVLIHFEFLISMTNSNDSRAFRYSNLIVHSRMFTL